MWEHHWKNSSCQKFPLDLKNMAAFLNREQRLKWYWKIRENTEICEKDRKKLCKQKSKNEDPTTGILHEHISPSFFLGCLFGLKLHHLSLEKNSFRTQTVQLLDTISNKFECPQESVPALKQTVRPWKWMVAILVSLWVSAYFNIYTF